MFRTLRTTEANPRRCTSIPRARVTTLSVLVWGTYPIASTTLTVDLLPNHWRSFLVYTDDGHHSCSHDLVTITTIVS